jgi:hypothetical protein
VPFKKILILRVPNFQLRKQKAGARGKDLERTEKESGHLVCPAGIEQLKHQINLLKKNVSATLIS